MALDDTAITYDLIPAQGANSASKMAQYVLQRIVEHDDHNEHDDRLFEAVWLTTDF